MTTNITFRNLEHTEALDGRIRSKSTKLQKLLGPEATVDWVCWVEKDNQISEVKVHSKGEHYIAKAHDTNLYHTFDMVVHKIEKQIHSKHGKSRAKLHDSNPPIGKSRSLEDDMDLED